MPAAIRGLDQDRIRPNLHHLSFKQSFDLSLLDPVLDVRADPVFDPVRERRMTVDERDAGAVPVKIQGRLGRRVGPSDHGNIAVEVRVRLGVVMRYFGQVLAGNPEQVRNVVVAGCEDQLLRGVATGVSNPGASQQLKASVLALDFFDQLILMDVELIPLRDQAVIFQRLQAGRLLALADHGKVADLQQLGRGEKDHVHGIVKNGIHHAPFFEHQVRQPVPLRFNGAGQPRWAPANNDYVK